MDVALSEITLVLFTTLAPAGVVGYLAMALAAALAREKARADAMARWLVVPLVLSITGLIASATHLGTPANALYVLTGIGRSPLSNEVVAAVAFLAVGGVYWIVSFRDDVGRALRAACCALAAVAGVAFVALISVAYSVPSVPTWNLPTAPVTLWLNALASGPLVAMASFALARQDLPRRASAALLGLSAAASLANAAVLLAEWDALGGVATTVHRATDLVPFMPAIIAAFLVLMACALALGVTASFGGARLRARLAAGGCDPFTAARRARSVRLVLVVGGALFALLACFAVRFAFYAMHMTVGI